MLVRQKRGKIVKLKFLQVCSFMFTSTFRFRNAAEYALLYAGSQKGKLDQISLVLFPVSFLAFSAIYWILYLSESRKRM